MSSSPKPGTFDDFVRWLGKARRPAAPDAPEPSAEMRDAARAAWREFQAVLKSLNCWRRLRLIAAAGCLGYALRTALQFRLCMPLTARPVPLQWACWLSVLRTSWKSSKVAKSTFWREGSGLHSGRSTRTARARETCQRGPSSNPRLVFA